MTAGKYGLGFAGLAYVLWSNPGLRDIEYGNVQLQPLALACSIFFLSLLLSFARWFVLVRALDLPFTPFNALRLGLLGFFWSTFFPGSVGGDVVKAYSISREQKRRSVAVATVPRGPRRRLVGPVLVCRPPRQRLLAGRRPCRPTEFAAHRRGALGLVAFTSSLWGVLLVLPERARREVRLATQPHPPGRRGGLRALAGRLDVS